ncbi:MAG TPA: hypothetical protein VMB85_02915 [Bryobacteraceae bacterium]|nr:hypothetical protein [Bryobacteraceae bacterium]
MYLRGSNFASAQRDITAPRRKRSSNTNKNGPDFSGPDWIELEPADYFFFFGAAFFFAGAFFFVAFFID